MSKTPQQMREDNFGVLTNNQVLLITEMAINEACIMVDSLTPEELCGDNWERFEALNELIDTLHAFSGFPLTNAIEDKMRATYHKECDSRYEVDYIKTIRTKTPRSFLATRRKK